MKKFKPFFIVAFMAMFASCLNYSDDLGNDGGKDGATDYLVHTNSLAVPTENDTIYSGVNSENLFFVTDKNDSIVAVQIDFGDGDIDGGTQVLHKYKTAGIYQLKITVTATATVIKRIVKITAPSVSTKETIVQLSGNTTGDSASINLLCKKDKIYNYGQMKGQYFLKGDMTNDWKTSIAAADTNFVYDGEKYILFNFKVKNGEWYSFGYYKTFGGSEQWGYDPNNQYWDATKGLYKFYVANARIYKNELKAQIPGNFGDPSTSSLGPVIRLDYETNGTSSDSLVIYANRNYLSGADSTKIGISYSVNGGEVVKKAVHFTKKADYVFIKVPVDKNSAVRFKTYKDIANNITGDMSGSIFYNSDLNDCYLKIAGYEYETGVPISRSAKNYELVKITLRNGKVISNE